MTREVIKWRADKYQGDADDTPTPAKKDEEIGWIHVNDEETGLHVHIDKDSIDNHGKRLSNTERVVLKDIQKETKWG